MLRELDKLNRDGFSLYNGKLGLCLIYGVTGLKLRERPFFQKAQELFYQIAEDIENLDSDSFSAGLLGFGWLTEYLVSNNIIALNTHSFLEALDDQIYLNVVRKKNPNLDLEKGNVGTALYLYKRISNKKDHNTFFRSICNVECLSILTERIYDKMNSAIFAKIPNEGELIPLSQVFLLFSKIELTRICNQTVNEVISIITKRIEEAFLYRSFLPKAEHNILALLSILNSMPKHNYQRYAEIKRELKNKIKNNYPDNGDTYRYLMTIDRKDRFGWKEAWLTK